MITLPNETDVYYNNRAMTSYEKDIKIYTQDEENELGPPSGTRLAPVGANAEEVEDSHSGSHSSQDIAIKYKQMEIDQEELNSSLFSLTSHFAKVQLRLQQVIAAPSEYRESLLKELEAFAFRGIPNLKLPNTGKDSEYPALQKRKQDKLIGKLKKQLEDLESYAYECGEGLLPSNLLLERQKIVMEQLKARLNLNVDNMDRLSEEELKAQVDEAVGEFVNPLKMKSRLVTQLKTQILDLEMFIQFLQREASLSSEETCSCKKHNKESRIASQFSSRSKSEQEEIQEETLSLLQRAMDVLQFTALSQFGCSSSSFYKNSLKATPAGNHYGDLRAKLELGIEHLLEVCSRFECLTDTDCTSLNSEPPEELLSSPQITMIVRREISVSLRDLIQHGLIDRSGGSGGRRASLSPFSSCMNVRQMRSGNHAWDIILTFYRAKGGQEYNSAPVQKLGQSFGLDLMAGNRQSVKQSLLANIGQIIYTHGPYKRSSDSMFKAFVCTALNQRQLNKWLKLIFKNQDILEYFYQPWSYVAKTGFVDGFHSLERLSMYGFDLPVNVAVKQFEELSDAF